MNEFDGMDDLMGLDDDIEFGLDDDAELDLDDDADVDLDGDFGDDLDGEDEYGAGDDDKEDLDTQSDDPEDPEDDSGPDINGEPADDTMGGIITRRGRYKRQQRIFRNRYRRAVRRADWRRGGAGVRRRLKRTFRRMKRLWSKMSDRGRVGLKNPARTRKDVVELYGPLPGGEAPEQGGPVRPTAGIAAGLYQTAPSGPAFVRSAGSAVPPLSAFQSSEVQRQAEATNYAQRFSAPPQRAPMTAPAYLAAQAQAQAPVQPSGVPVGTVLDQMASMTNARLMHIAQGGGIGVFSSPAARMNARQILRSRGISPAQPEAFPVTPRPVPMAPARPFVGPMRQATLPGFQPPPIAPLRDRPFVARPFAARPLVASPPAAQPSASPTPVAPLRLRAMSPGLRLSPGVVPGAPGVRVPPMNVQLAIKPPPAGLSRFPAPPKASANMGFDTYGEEPGVAPVVADGYSVVPDFTTLGMSAIKEHPLKTIASVAGLFVAGAFLAKPVGNMIRSRIG